MPGCFCFGGGGKPSDTGAVVSSRPGLVKEGSLVKSKTRGNNVVRVSANFQQALPNKKGDDRGNDEQLVKVEKGDVNLVFFDAVEDQLADDEYPIITTSFIRKAPRVNFFEPETMLRSGSEWDEARFEDAVAEPTENGEIDHDGRLRTNPAVEVTMAYVDSSVPAANGVVTVQSPSKGSTTDAPAAPESSSSINNNNNNSPRSSTMRKKSPRSFRIKRRPSMTARKDLEKPRVMVQERGYPGQLTEEELLQCQMFYREIHQRKGHYLEIVYGLKDSEDEPYAICRFMRATKFDAAEQLNRLEQGKDLWEGAAKEGFYKDIERALGVPLQVFLEYYPYFYYGNAKNGCPVNYFRAGSLDTQALLSMVPAEQNTKYFWHTFYHSFREKMAEAREKNPDFVRCESINVIDLKGMSSAQLTSEAMDCMKGVGALANFFPETLHCMVILNAPTWFSLTWKIIKTFIDPRTARKITVYSNESKGNARLLELVDKSQIPNDFGGSAPSLTKSIRDYCRNDGRTNEYFSSFVTLRNKSDHKKAENVCTLKSDEKLTITCYTRSVYGAAVSVLLNGTKKASQDVKRTNPAQFTVENPNKAFTTSIVTEMEGPGKVTIDVKGLGDFDPHRKLPSSGNFMFVLDITPKN